MLLSNLTDGYSHELNPDIKGITSDSRNVDDGYLFAALSGVHEDGASYIPDAIDKGAVAILAIRGTELPEGVKDAVALIEFDNPRQGLAYVVSRFYGQQPKSIVAVTGTNGKTSVAYFTQQLWQKASYKAVSLGTLGLRGDGPNVDGALTTPDTVSLHSYLSDIKSLGIDNVAMEASSHGLDQYRLDGVGVVAAGFTNLSHDHLDYHKDMDDYFNAKSRLFSSVLKVNGHAVLNADSECFEKLKMICNSRSIQIIDYGFNAQALKVNTREALPDGQSVSLEVGGNEYDFKLPLIGEFQLYNSLCALGLAYASSDKGIEQYINLLSGLKGAPGRLEAVNGHPNGAMAYIDYAHTPDALKTVLKAIRPHTQGRLICLFGCGGDRDAKKRPVMGKIAADYSDIPIVTDDNPRGEDPSVIREQVIKGCPDALNVGDRGQGIATALQLAEAGDVVLIAGKGHEEGQTIQGKTYPFNDLIETKTVIENLS